MVGFFGFFGGSGNCIEVVEGKEDDCCCCYYVVFDVVFVD